MKNRVYTLLGLGLGPANLALAAAIDEQQPNQSLLDNCLFIEKKAAFSWHPGMLLPGAKLQVPFTRDLATLRNPQSPFTFLNYLKEKQRLDHFINLRTFYPSRAEFYDYLLWVCQQVRHCVKFNFEVISISPHWNAKQQFANQLKITCLDKEKQQLKEILANNIIVGMGKQPFMPACAVNTDPRIIHTHYLIPQLTQQFPDFKQAYEFAVVGSGQSAGEATLYILNQYPNARVHLCFRSFALKGIDNSPFVNQQYHQTAVDAFYELEDTAKLRALTDLKQSNYAVVDAEVLANLTQINYESLLQQNQPRLITHGCLHLKEIKTQPHYIEVLFDNLYQNSRQPINADGVILATGYTEKPTLNLLELIEEFLLKKADGSYQVSRSYKLITQPQLNAGIYLQGYCENTHGPSDATLAILATRAKQILDSVLSHDQAATKLKLEEYACN